MRYLKRFCVMTLVCLLMVGIVSSTELVSPIKVEASSKSTTTSKTTTKKTKKTETMKNKAKKSKTTTNKKTKVSTKTSSKGNSSVKTVTTVVTTTVTKVTKGSKKKVITTTVKTTVKTTTTVKKSNSTKSTTKSTNPTGTNTAVNNTPTVKNVSIYTAAPKAHANVLKAFNTLGFTCTVNTGVSYSGYFSSANRSITLRVEGDEDIYHELGHFIAFVAGNADTKASFKTIYDSEKGKYTGFNKAYVTQNSSEYFAESYKDYVLTPSTMKKNRPRTYAAIESAVNSITDTQVERIRSVYSVVWK